MKKVIIIGSGLSGLSSAHYLDKNIFDVSIYEQEHFLGGRARSENIDGFTCDVGFQVLLDNYDEIKKLGIYESLKLKYFDSGAQIYTDSGILSLYNPVKHPFKFLKSNLFKIFNFKDYFSVIYFLFKKNSFNTTSVKKIFNRYFSRKSRHLFFNPFFKGIFLSSDLRVSSDFFLKIFKKFASGKASLPKNGMGEIAKKMGENIKDKIQYNHKAIKVEENTVYFENGKNARFDFLIFASLPVSIDKVISTEIKMDYNFNKTIYFKSKKNVLEKSILLIPDNSYGTNSIQCLSNVSSSYSINGEHLYSLSSIERDVSDKKLTEEFKKILGMNNSDFKLLKSYSLRYALPSNIKTECHSGKIHFCGDWTNEPSIDGAIKSGRTLAENLNQSVES